MSVHLKLMQARVRFNKLNLKKTGNNKFAGYNYFELGDFLPQIQEIFADLGLCGIVSYETDMAKLCITDTEDGTAVVITSPMSEAALKGCHPVQNLGAVQTYIRRYLWTTALELVEHDPLDMTTGKEEKEAKAEPKKESGNVAKAAPKPPAKIEGKTGPWQLTVTTDPEADLPAWIGIVMEAARLALSQAANEKDIMDIFKVNRIIFDRLKADAPEDYTALMADFTKRKNELKENANGN